MARAFFTLVIMLLSINIILFLGGVRVLDDGSESNFLPQFVDVTGNETLKTSSDFDEVIPNSFQKTGTGTSFFSFIDPIASIIKALTFIINITLTPLGLLGDIGLPQTLQWIIGVPMMVMGLLGLMFFLRGVSN